MMLTRLSRGISVACCLLGLNLAARGQVLDANLHHLRHGGQREWDEFPEQPEDTQLRVNFDGKANVSEQTLSLRHRDLRLVWNVLVNGREVARLAQDDNRMVTLIPLSPGTLKDGANTIQVACTDKTSEADDVEVGEVALIDRPRKEIVTEASLDVSVVDGDTESPLPCRLTIIDDRGAVVPLGIESAPTLAVRPGVVYTSTGTATLKLPAGRYTVYAGRGFEWGIDTAKVDLRPGANPALKFSIRREVNTTGYVAADTHIHTFTYSRHGDATLAERMITLAGEGIEFPIATDHNLPVDYDQAARTAGVRVFFTPVVGNEVTTPRIGHFNVFPVDKAAPLIDFRAPTWERLFADIDARAPGAVVILNHARDLHGGFRPFDPSRHIALTGEDLDGQVLRANAMEVINSGATLNDPLLLYRDWMGCLNRGVRLTPVGASDSHDVSRFIVGQGRTYVRCNDGDPGKIDVNKAIESIKAGRVLVSFGLLVDLTVNKQFGPGDVARPSDEISVDVTVAGPSWTRVSRIELYANGLKIHHADIDPSTTSQAGVKKTINWRLPKPAHDVCLTAIATGPGVTDLYWPVAKPYQRTSTHWTPYVLGCTGAVWIDADGSGTVESAYDYARRIVSNANGDANAIVKQLGDYDAAVAAQAASLLRSSGTTKSPDELEALTKEAPVSVRTGFTAYASDWRQSNSARALKEAAP